MLSQYVHDLQILGGRMPTTIIFGGSMIILSHTQVGIVP